jgi:hypothetical protein
MRIIELDAGKWATDLDFYNALLAALGSPKWHGYSVDALVDSMIWGGINAVEPLYIVRVQNVSRLPKAVVDEIELVKRELARSAC